MSEKELEEAAEKISKMIPDALVADDKVVMFTIHERLPPKVLEVLVEYDLHLHKPGMIQYTHKEKTKMGSEDNLVSTFSAK